MKSFYFVLISMLLANCASSLNILVICPVGGSGHFLPFHALVQGLAERNHNVTYFSVFKPKPSANIHHVPIILPPEDEKEVFHFNSNVTMFNGPTAAFDFGIIGAITCGPTLFSKTVTEFFKQEGNTYDIVILEAFNTHCFSPVAKKYNAPLVLFTCSMMLPWHNDAVGQPYNTAYIPSMMSGQLTRMNFCERVQNTINHFVNLFIFDYIGTPNDFEQSKKAFGSDIPPFHKILRNVSLHLVNSHHSVLFPMPSVPQVIEVGGIHMHEDPKPVPKNIEKWINESEHGVIYFSMGSMIKGHTFPEEKRKIFLRAFGRLKQRVLWKWENDTMPGKPDNVMIQKWMPQFDILCHPNVKAFISHGGLLGTTEAVHCGVPVVVMPQFGDQHTNAKALEAGNGGVILNFRDADEEAVYKALKAVLDPEFNKKAKELSARFRDRPMSPMDTAIYWIEYVARHKGAHHMRTAAVGMPLYQYLLLDVFAFLALIVIVTFVVFFYTLKFFLCFLKSLFASPKKVKKN